MRGIIKRVTLGIVAIALAMSNTGGFIQVFANDPVTIYELYPSPQSVQYAGSQTDITQAINIVAEDGIDSYTRKKIEEVLAIKDLSVHNAKVTYSDAIVENKTNILLGIHGSGGVVDAYFSQQGLNDATHFEEDKYDAHILDIKEHNIAILGQDSDATFFGITTLKEIFNQMSTMSIEKMTVKDFADIENRGFIEGYYGTPWSTQDRVNLMKYGGDLKMNQYLFAPKDDPYHNAKWRVLYPADELAEIEKLAVAGNETKNHFVWTIHCFMNSPFNFSTEATYQNDLGVIQAKFTQLLGVGVRQFGVLADDAGAASNENQVRLLNDLTTWLTAQKEIYPDLNINLPYCPEAYFYANDSAKAQLSALNTAPDNVQIMNTGQKTTNNGVWGKVTDTHAAWFREYIKTEGHPGRKPYFWINWPCIDNTKQRLIMGGNDVFFTPGIDPTNIRGIVINPMMHAEANKSALFATADYAWQIWEDKAESDKNWHDSFKYMDHNTAAETETSTALRELSKHMIKQGQDGRVQELEESVDLAPKINAFMNAYKDGADIQEKGTTLLAEFKTIETSADLYLKDGHPDVAREIGAHIKSLRDVAIANQSFIKAAMVIQESEDYDIAWQEFSAGQAAMENAKGHTFLFHTSGENFQMVAQAGMQHIVPFANQLATLLEVEIGPIVNPNLQITKFITSRTDTSIGDVKNALDGDDATSTEYRSPALITADTYIGVSYTKPIELNDVRFVMGGGKNHIYHGKIQYTEDGKVWKDLDGTVYNNLSTSGKVVIDRQNIDLDVKVKGVRLIATQDNGVDAYLTVFGVDVNKEVLQVSQRYSGTASYQTSNMNIRSGNVGDISDANDSTHVDFVKGPTYVETDADRDTIAVDNWVALSFDEAKPIGKVSFVQTGAANAINKAVIEYSVDGSTNWIKLDEYSDGRAIYTGDFTRLNISAKSIRVRNVEAKGIWWNVCGLDVWEPTIANDEVDNSTPIVYNIIKPADYSVYQGSENNLNDKNDATTVEYNPGVGDNSEVGDYIGYDLGRNAYIGKVHIVVGNLTRVPSNKWEQYRLETSVDNVNWETYGDTINGVASGKDVIDVDLQGKVARYVRLYNMQLKHAWCGFAEFNVEEDTGIGTTKNLYTNIRTNAKVIAKNEQASLIDARGITLASNEYIGIKLDRIKDIQSIEAQHNQPTLTLESSMNEIEWTTVHDVNNVEDAKYIRLMNKTTAPLSVDIETLTVNSNEVSVPTLHSSSIVKDPVWGSEDSRENGAAFDKKIGTSTEFAGLPKLNDTIIYDLGRNQEINNFGLYVVDNTLNYIRDAVIEVSPTVDGTYTPIATIGDGVENAEGNADANATASNSGLYMNDGKYPNYVSVKATDLNVQGRFLRIRMSAANKNRAISFNEIEINVGDYAPSVNDPTIIVDPIEMPGYEPANMIDRNLSSAYKPNTNNGLITSGSILYRLSSFTNTGKINIIQSGSTLSKAKVFIRGSNDNGQTSSWKEIGSLDKSFNEFVNYYFKNVFELKIEWDGIAPTIQEIIVVEEYTIVAGNTEALQAKINEVKPIYEADKDTYTISSKKALAEAIQDGEDVLQMYIKTQELIDKTLANLVSAYTKVTLKATDTVAFVEAYETMLPFVETNYLSNGWVDFKTARDRAKAIYDALDNYSQAEVDQALLILTTTKDVLVEKTKVEALQTFVVNTKANYVEADYTVDSFTALKTAITTSENVLNATATITNKKLLDATTAMDNAIKALIDIRPLKVAIAKAEETLGEDFYTPASWANYTERLKEAKAVLAKANATASEVATAITTCEEAINGLVIQSTKTLEAAVLRGEALSNEAGKYTLDSFSALQALLADAKAYLADPNAQSEELTKAKTEALEATIEALVNVQSLHNLIKEIKLIENETDYTVASWSTLQTVLQTAESLIANGSATQENVDSQVKALLKAKDELVIIRELRNTIKTAKEVDITAYTKVTYDALAAAIVVAEDVLANDSATLKQVHDAQRDIIATQQALELKADTIALQKALDSAFEYVKNESRYTSDSYEGFKHAYDVAKVVMEDANATLKDSDKVMKDLQKAIENLKIIIKLNDTTSNIQINSSTAELPEHVVLSVTPVIQEKQLEELFSVLPKLTNKLTAYDINLLLDGKNIQPNGRVELRLPISEGYDRNRLALYALHAGKVEEMPFKIDGDTMVVNTDHFSIYAIVELKKQEGDIVPEIPEVVPNVPHNQGTSSEANSVNTGDNSNMISLVFMLCISAGFLVFMKKQKKA